MGAAAVSAFLVAVGGGFYWLSGGRWIDTDDAYVQADSMTVSTDVSGIVTSIPVLLRANLASILPNVPALEAMLLVLTIHFMIKSRDIEGQIVFLMDMQAADAFQKMLAQYLDSLS